MYKLIHKLQNKALLIFASFLLITGLFLSSSLGTSPIYPHNYSYDSAFFRFIGSEILKGKIPYTNIWDHKGPVLFFIQALGALGGTANKGTNILFLMQLIANYISSFLMYKLYRLLNPKNKSNFKFFFILFSVCTVYSLTMESGNLSEEWCIPMISCSFYLFVKFAVKAEIYPEHPPVYAFLHGILIGTASLIRMNNVIPIIAGSAAIGIFLSFKKQYKNIALNISAGIFGILLIWLPVFVWFYSHGALSEMLFAVFQFNIRYTQTRTFIHFQGEPFVTRYFPIAAAILIMAVTLIKNRSFHLIDGITLAVLGAGVYMMSVTNVYLHYFTTFLPVLFFVLIYNSNRMGKIEICILLCVCLWFGIQNIKRMEDLLNLHRQPQMFTAAEKIPEEDRSSVIAVNLPPEIYLNYGLEPVSRFCAYQHIHLAYVPEFKTEFLEILRTTPPKWILAFCSGETNIPEVQTIIDTNYQYRFDQSNICYYESIQ